MPDPVTASRVLRTHADVWVVDPRRTETARLARGHLAPRPGTDQAVLAFLVREVLRDGADREVLEHHTAGCERLAAAVEPFTLEDTARTCSFACMWKWGGGRKPPPHPSACLQLSLSTVLLAESE
jgi:anaerobic selenocysteine-containing dehydrogenase